MADDPYQTLGVARDADQAAIRKAYRALAKKHHPDLNPGDKVAEATFKDIAGAYELLSDAEKRAAFDRGEIDASGQPRPERAGWRDFAEGAAGGRYRPGGERRTSGHPAGGWGASEEELGDIFSSIFGDGASAGAGPRRGPDERYGLTVDLLDVVQGATRRLTLPDGRVLDVRIPAGLEDGQTLRLRGRGAPGRQGGTPGDALIEISVAPHPFFRREGSDIHLDALPVSLREAALGGRIMVPTPAGPVSMTLPAHSDSGKTLRLRGRGVPAHGDLPAGDLFVTLRVVLGEPDPELDAFLASGKARSQPDPRAEMLRQAPAAPGSGQGADQHGASA